MPACATHQRPEGDPAARPGACGWQRPERHVPLCGPLRGRAEPRLHRPRPDRRAAPGGAGALRGDRPRPGHAAGLALRPTLCLFLPASLRCRTGCHSRRGLRSWREPAGEAGHGFLRAWTRGSRQACRQDHHEVAQLSEATGGLSTRRRVARSSRSAGHWEPGRSRTTRGGWRTFRAAPAPGESDLGDEHAPPVATLHPVDSKRSISSAIRDRNPGG